MLWRRSQAFPWLQPSVKRLFFCSLERLLSLIALSEETSCLQSDLPSEYHSDQVIWLT